MREAPRISVITITLNDLPGLIYTVESVENQKYRNYEHIVVDGMSSDGTADYCLATGKRLDNFSFISERDRGIYDAMNKGARMASGDILVFVNSSDGLTDPWVLSFVADRWVERGDWLWGYGAMRFTNANRVAFSGSIQAPFRRRKFELGINYVNHAACYIDRNFFLDQGAYDESFGTAADQEFFLRVCRAHPPAVWIKFLADFMVGGVSMQESAWARETLWHQMRVKNGVAVADNRHIDRLVSLTFATAKSAKATCGRAIRKQRGVAKFLR